MTRLLPTALTINICVLLATALNMASMPAGLDSIGFMGAYVQIPLLFVALCILSWSLVVHDRVMSQVDRLMNGLPPSEMARHAAWISSRERFNG